MLSDFSSLFEVTFAFYASLCINNKVGVKLWQARISPSLTNYLELSAESEVSALKNSTKEIVNLRLMEKYKRIRMAGWIMFVINLAVLVSFGYESSIVLQRPFFAVIEFCMIVLLAIEIAIITSHRYIRKMIFVLGVCIIALLSVMVGIRLRDNYSWEEALNLIDVSKLVLKSSLVIIILMPVVYTLMWKSLAQIRYFKYVESLLEKELHYLISVKNMTRNGASTLEELEGIPNDYMKLIILYNRESSDREDIRISHSEDVLKKRLNSSVLEPTIITLVRDIFVNDETQVNKHEDAEIPDAEQS